ncbi:MAG: hypothetical protein LBO63_00700 [Oscillospiraceae bacterium]|jgi:hypothetical protein|nr:hypothetical protein [Oscillospiraceae bacterium]
MRIAIELILALVLFAAMYFLWRFSGAVCFTPIRAPKDIRIDFVVSARAEADGLGETVRSLKWLAETAAPGARVIIADAGLSSGARTAAELIERDSTRVDLYDMGELTKLSALI